MRYTNNLTGTNYRADHTILPVTDDSELAARIERQIHLLMAREDLKSKRCHLDPRPLPCRERRRRGSRAQKSQKSAKTGGQGKGLEGRGRGSAKGPITDTEGPIRRSGSHPLRLVSTSYAIQLSWESICSSGCSTNSGDRRSVKQDATRFSKPILPSAWRNNSAPPSVDT